MGHERYSFGALLRSFRTREGIEQMVLAQKLDCHRNTIGAWERGNSLPDLTTVHELINVLQLDVRDAEALFLAHSAHIPRTPLWTIPYARNPYFTGREALLQYLHRILQRGEYTPAGIQSCALYGLGGIGKTQLAVEYAYRFRKAYRALFWVQADTYDTIIASFVSIAEVLKLPGKYIQNSQQMVNAVKHWLHTSLDWLLIIDNLEDRDAIRPFLPQMDQGSLLLTTQCQVPGTLAPHIEVQTMTQDEGTAFLLHRTQLPDRVLEDARSYRQYDHNAAIKLVQALDGLPLALDQAGAYMEETGCSIVDYLAFYYMHRAELLGSRGNPLAEHPISLVATWSRSFAHIEQLNGAAIELLHLYAFLHPDDIPDEFILQGASIVDTVFRGSIHDAFQLNESIRVLRMFSFVQRRADSKSVTIHRLVQSVLKDGMELKTRHLWVERVIRIVNHLFPATSAALYYLCKEWQSEWARARRYLPHVQACVELMRQEKVATVDAIQLLLKLGNYLSEHGRYHEAEEYLMLALSTCTQTFPEDYIYLDQSWMSLGALAFYTGMYRQAEGYLQKAFVRRQHVFGSTHPAVAQALNCLAWVAAETANYRHAQELFIQAISISEHLVEGQPVDTPEYSNSQLELAHLRMGLALCLSSENHYDHAEQLVEQALATIQHNLGADHPSVGMCYSYLATIYLPQQKYAQAEQLLEKALFLWTHGWKTYHILEARFRAMLAQLLLLQGKISSAEIHAREAMTIAEQTMSRDHLWFALCLFSLAGVYQQQGCEVQAEVLYQQALSIRVQVLGATHPLVNEILECLQRKQ